MAYRGYRKSYRSYGSSSYGYSSTGYGKYKSEAYHVDGGANDEGYNWRHCYTCSEKTEHDMSECLSCGCQN